MILILLFMITTVNAAECPASCSCRIRPQIDADNPQIPYTIITCKSTNVTYNFPDNTETLIFSEITNFMFLMDNLSIVQKLPYLKKVSITDTVLPNLYNISVRGLDRLKTLEIAKCHVEYLPDFNLSSLETLDLSNNILKVIEDKQFRTLQGLKVLNLSANSLEVIAADGFMGLTNLKCLDISINHLSELNDSVLIPLTSLQHLNLSNNRLEILNEACFSSLFYLQQLDVSWNRLAHVAPGSLELPSLARLLLAGNPQLGVSREPTLLVGTGRRLQTVDASQTGLKQVPAALTHSIRTLRLAGNFIRMVNCGDLDSYPLLQLLDFTSNELETIEDDALGRLDSLTILYLTDNKLVTVPHSLPERLRVLHLENNKLENIQPADLQGMLQLEVLLLSRNKITVIKGEAFEQLTSLANLDLSYNPINVLPSGSLTGPAQLRVLRLAGLNVISNAKEVEFPLPTPEHLITLDLSNSPGLARQMLADTAALAASRELQELNLATSELSNIRSDLLHYLPQLRIIHLYENPLNCSELQWLAEWMRRQNDPEYRKVMCVTPAELWGTLLVDLQNIEPETTTMNHAERKENAERENNSNNNNAANVQTSSMLPKGNGKDNSLGTTPLTKSSTMSDDKVSTKPDLIPTFSTSVPDFTVQHNEIPTDKIFDVIDKSKNKINKFEFINNQILKENISVYNDSKRTAALTTIDTDNKATTPYKIKTASYLRATVTAMHILTERKSQVRNVNNILKDIEMRSDGNLFMEKSLNKQESVSEKYDNGLHQEAVAKVADLSSTRSTSSDLRNWEHENVMETAAPTGETSKYSGESRGKQLAHPGMVILAIGILSIVAMMIWLTTKMSRRNRRRNSIVHDDIEVSSLPSVTELW